MDDASYKTYLTCAGQGRKAEATAALNQFLQSFAPTDDRHAWVMQFLEGDKHEHTIRHEIYEQLVFPVLLDGYARKDTWSTVWLAKTIGNLYRCRDLHCRIGFKGERELLQEAFGQQPTDDIRAALLAAYLRSFSYAIHEWPAGVLSGTNGASIQECDQILNDVAFATTLDEGANAAFLMDVEGKVKEYLSRLSSHQQPSH